MPELPEVETTARILKTVLVGKTITSIEIFSKKQFPNDPKLIIGSKITDVDRRAKILVIYLDNNYLLITHLKLTGQLVFAGPGRSTRIVFRFADRSALFFNDLRKFGWIKILKKSQFNIDTFDNLGIEPLSNKFTQNGLINIFGKTRRAVKVVLMDQKLIAGIGNIYANEALFLAKINPQRPANSLLEKEIIALKKAIIKVLKDGIKYQGTSADDDAYIKPDGSKGSNQNYLLVYQKAGQKCPNCQQIIKRTTIGGRGTFFCPSCQK